MASIVLSFVGLQDPFAKGNNEGSIISLLRYLVADGCEIKEVVLLYTESTQQGAIDTKDWIESEIGLLSTSVSLIKVSQDLSDDPIDLLLAAEEAKKGLEFIQKSLELGDRIEFNASSGTPAMKSAFSLLQASGYVQNGRVLQVRNPYEMKEGQERIFETNVTVLRREFDRRVIVKQLEDYNYGGALRSLKISCLNCDDAILLLEYGRCRMAFDFNRAFSNIKLVKIDINPQLLQEIAALRQRKLDAICKELYFNALVRYKNLEFSEFLVLISQFQECFLALLLVKKLRISVPNNLQEAVDFWHKVKMVDGGKPYQELLKDYRVKGWDLTPEGYPNRFHLIGILDYYAELKNVLIHIKKLNEYCEQRNRRVHRFEGVSVIDNGVGVIAIMKKLVKLLTLPNESSFDLLNKTVLELIG
ncbi:hypothetical protein Syn7502_02842 [Synechococcus sp. PCC 7502]|uniref:hypothetical protein n=1 Tax=Synechococcus sp. PCC 7502 TaxID=1173263 RepID=UPI00029F9A70|nr:hypothetical protein [Synechococcus sp. PCC 7502]AFY74779.1 hypothetical protein Syn7502_02842 [Synechococcus sp. PCC 7502]